MSSYYVKIPKLLTVLDDSSKDCEEKLSTLKTLITGSSPYESDSAVRPSEPQPVAPPEVTIEDKFEKIFKESPGAQDKKNARALLQEIEKSNKLKWSIDSMELILDGEIIKYTNVLHLIKLVISTGPASLPLGLTLFCDALMSIKAPLTLIRNGDAKEIWSNLTRIHEANGKVIESPPDPSLGAPEAASTEQDPDQPSIVGKRPREPDEEEDANLQPSGKRPAPDKAPVYSPKGGAKKTFGLEKDKLKGLRRSPKLKAEIENAWKSGNGNQSGSKRNLRSSAKR